MIRLCHKSKIEGVRMLFLDLVNLSSDSIAVSGSSRFNAPHVPRMQSRRYSRSRLPHYPARRILRLLHFKESLRIIFHARFGWTIPRPKREQIWLPLSLKVILLYFRTLWTTLSPTDLKKSRTKSHIRRCQLWKNVYGQYRTII